LSQGENILSYAYPTNELIFKKSHPHKGFLECSFGKTTKYMANLGYRVRVHFVHSMQSSFKYKNLHVHISLELVQGVKQKSNK